MVEKVDPRVSIAGIVASDLAVLVSGQQTCRMALASDAACGKGGGMVRSMV
jgi:hypothetical protein